MKDHAETLLKLIEKDRAGRRFILAIDGLSRSGKTTLAKSLCESLRAKGIAHSLFHIDDHITKREKRYQTGQDEWFEYYFLQWELHHLRQHFFENLLLTKDFTLQYYDGESDSLTDKSINLPEECVIIIEGVFLQRQEWSGFFDYVVYLDCPQKVRFSRESEETRQNIEKFRKRYWPAEEFYLKAVSPKQKADLVLPG